ncbi:MAG TPA: hypothetical protein VLH94_02535 [Spirochaetia bacterium]|nr:hypothetical protein [Spirochaetia bacterium]
MKIYVCTQDVTPSSLLDISKLVESDIVIIEKVNGFLTVIYAISEKAKQKLSEIDLKKLKSDFFDSAFICIMNLERTKQFLEEKIPNVEYIETKTSQ